MFTPIPGQMIQFEEHVFFKWAAKKHTLDIQARSFLNLRVTSVKKTISHDGQILATPPSKKGLPPPNDKGLTMVYIIRQ